MRNTSTLTPVEPRYRATGLAQAMTEKGILQTWLARKVGIHNAHLANIKYGKRTATEETARRIADVLNTPFSWLFVTSSDTESTSDQTGDTPQ